MYQKFHKENLGAVHMQGLLRCIAQASSHTWKTLLLLNHLGKMNAATKYQHFWKESFHRMSSHHILKMNFQTDRLWLFTTVPWCYDISTLYQTTDNSHVGLPLWKKKAFILGERWKRRLSDYILFVYPHLPRIKEGILFPRCVWMNLTALDDRSVARGVIMRR
jgi:hypothetical protein